MTTYRGTAPGKVILFGEHAVVYGQPALAVPVHDLTAEAFVHDGSPGQGLIIQALDLGLHLSLAEEAAHALTVTAQLVLDKLGLPEPDALIRIHSDIPIASGLGSGAAVSAALARALAGYLGHSIPASELSALVYEVEKVHHGTPSGIDNSVICYSKPVYFIREKALDTFHAKVPFQLLIGDTGIASPTRTTVGAVCEAWQRDPARYEKIFASIGQISQQARQAIEQGDVDRLGPLMASNQNLLRQLDVSCEELEHLIAAALSAGASGAKLSGGGRGGNMIALVSSENRVQVRDALLNAGAVRVHSTTVR